MDKVVTFSLNGNAYQIDESGFDKIVAYLEHAKAQLRGNTDASEIICDLEQAIAEKCHRYLSARKNVIKAEEMESVIREMGPVVIENENPDAATEIKTEPATKKRLYQIQEGAWLTGLCKGISVYSGYPVMGVRGAVVVLAMITGGWGLLAYIAAVLLVPFAKTGEDLAHAEGFEFNAQSLVDRARTNYSRLKDDHTFSRRVSGHYQTLRTKFNDEAKSWSQGFRSDGGYAPPITAGSLVLAPIFGIIKIILFLLLVAALVTVTAQGAMFGIAIPPTIPLWAVVLALVVAYNLVSAPFSIANTGHYGRGGFRWRAKAGVLELFVTAFAFWFAYQAFPEVRQFVAELPYLIESFIQWFRGVIFEN